jgi:hypothetical protein
MTITQYINALEQPRKSEIKQIHAFIKKTFPKQKPELIGNIIMYGCFDYKSKSGCTGRWGVLGLASRKNYISIYACACDGKEYVAEKSKESLKPANVGKGCIRYKKLKDINFKALEKVMKQAVKLGGESMFTT